MAFRVILFVSCLEVALERKVDAILADGASLESFEGPELGLRWMGSTGSERSIGRDPLDVFFFFHCVCSFPVFFFFCRVTSGALMKSQLHDLAFGFSIRIHDYDR